MKMKVENQIGDKQKYTKNTQSGKGKKGNTK